MNGFARNQAKSCLGGLQFARRFLKPEKYDLGHVVEVRTPMSANDADNLKLRSSYVSVKLCTHFSRHFLDSSYLKTAQVSHWCTWMKSHRLVCVS